MLPEYRSSGHAEILYMVLQHVFDSQVPYQQSYLLATYERFITVLQVMRGWQFWDRFHCSLATTKKRSSSDHKELLKLVTVTWIHLCKQKVNNFVTFTDVYAVCWIPCSAPNDWNELQKLGDGGGNQRLVSRLPRLQLHRRYTLFRRSFFIYLLLPAAPPSCATLACQEHSFSDHFSTIRTDHEFTALQVIYPQGELCRIDKSFRGPTVVQNTTVHFCNAVSTVEMCGGFDYKAIWELTLQSYTYRKSDAQVNLHACSGKANDTSTSNFLHLYIFKTTMA